MAETHINAYFAAVDEAKLKVREAENELTAAKVALEAKKKEVGFVEEKPQEEPQPEVHSQPVEDTKNKGSKKK